MVQTAAGCPQRRVDPASDRLSLLESIEAVKYETGQRKNFMETSARRSLADHPAAAEFDLEANAPATPSEFAWGSKAIVWWRCSTAPAHRPWRATINNRTKPRGSGCPACRGNRLRGPVPADRSLLVRMPQVASELDVDRSGFTADQVTYGSKRDARWRCQKGHEYAATVNQRTNKSHPQGCPYCSGKLVAPDRSLQVIAPSIAAELDAGKSAITAEMLMPNSNRRVWWRCAVDVRHAWQATPNNRVSRGSGCPYCSGALVSDANRLSLNSPDHRLLAEWDYEGNKPLTPEDVSTGSNRKVWWVCDAAADHRWSSSVSTRVNGRGCPFCAGTRVSSANRLSTLRPDVARELDADASGVTADQLSVGSNRVVTWTCIVDDSHIWRASVLNRTSGHAGRAGTGCPYCQLPGTSAQELQLKAELAAVLPVDIGRTAVPDTNGTPVLVDIVIADSDTHLQIIVEFDGSWWHGKPGDRQTDTAKTARLRQAGWIVIRVREHPLDLIGPELDVPVPLAARATDVAAKVLERLAALGLIQAEQALRYRQQAADGPINAELAYSLIRSRLGNQAACEHMSQDEAWNQMYNALAAFAVQHGHCRVPSGVEVRGVKLAVWIYKQRSRFRSGSLPAERVQRLRAIPAWSFDPRADTLFRAGRAQFLSATNSGGLSMPRSASVWASNLRARRQRLLKIGTDLPADQLRAMEEIPGWQWDPPEAAFQAKFSILRDYLALTGKNVSDIRQRDHWNEHKIGTWINSWRTRRDKMTDQHRRALEDLPGWTWSARSDQWEGMFQRLADFARYSGHARPSLTAANEQEHALAIWKRNNKNRLRGQDNQRANRLRKLLARYGEELL